MNKQQKSKSKVFLRYTQFILVTILLIGLTTGAICGIAGAVYVNTHINPHIDINLEDFKLNFTSFVYYVDSETGEEKELSALHGTENRIWTDISEMPQMLKDAYVSVEDARFYKHNGVDWKRTLGAALNYVVNFRDNFGGGSTITQQLIKNLTGEDETSVKRKVQEIFRAIELDRKYEKDEILELYLNTIYLGQGANGVKTAAMTYFGKELSELNLAECASLAGISKNPYKYDIVRFPEYNKERRIIVLGEMLKNKKITQEEYDEACNYEVSTENGTKNQNIDKKQSYFVDEIIMSVTEDLMREKGYSNAVASQLLYTGGLKIISTIDPKVQALVDEVFIDEENLPGYMGKDGTMPQTSMVITDPYTGHVVAMYGGRGEKEGLLVLNRATRTKRPPGSAIKPLTIYAPALEYGVISPISVFDDVPKNFVVKESGWPKNYYDYYRGRMSITKAVEISNNPIPVELLDKIDAQKAFSFANINLGLTSLVESRTKTNSKGKTTVYSDISAGPLALGGLTDGLTVKEMAAAYGAFVNDGKYTNPVVYTKVLDSKGNVILDNTPKTNVAMTSKTSTYMLELLKNVVTGPEGTGKRAALPGIEVGAKTGTTNDDYDRWFVGITPYYSGAVWFGYDTPQKIKTDGSNPALVIWKKVMEKVHKDLEPKKFKQSVDLISVRYCADSGLVPTEWCSADIRGSRVVSGRVVPEDAPTEKCKVHVGIQIDSVTNMIANDYCPTGDIQTRGIMDLKREFDRAGIVVSDQEYSLAHYPSNGAYGAVGGVSTEGCTEHTALNDGNKPPEVIEPPVTDPENPDGGDVVPPENPDKPDNPDNPPTDPVVPGENPEHKPPEVIVP